MKICTAECEHAQKYNSNWAVCWNDIIKGSKVQLNKYCIVDLIETTPLEDRPPLKILGGTK